MEYRCNQCDITFSSEDERGKARCPQCLSIHPVEPVPAQAPAGGRKWIPAAVLLAAAGLAGAYWLLTRADQPATDRVETDLDAIYARHRLGDENRIHLLRDDEALTRWVGSEGNGASGPALLAALHTALHRQMGTGWSLHAGNLFGPVPAPLLPGQVAAALMKGKSVTLTRWNAAAFLWAAARAGGVDATMVEIFSYADDKAPADPHGVFGAFAVMERGGKRLFDPVIGRPIPVSQARYRPLPSDTAAHAGYFAHKAVAAMADGDTKAANDAIGVAIDCDPDEALWVIHRGKVFLASGAIQQALDEFERAKKIKDWAVTRLSVAQVAAMTGQSPASLEGEIRAAIQEYPRYAQARLLLANLLLAQGDEDAAREELAAAQDLAPDAPEVAMGWAQYHLAQHDEDKAVAAARKAARLAPRSFDIHVGLAQILKMLGRDDQAAAAAHKAVALAPSDEVAAQLRQAFDLESSVDDTDAAEDTADTEGETTDALPVPPPPPAPALQLKLPGRDAANRPSLGGGSLRLSPPGQ